MSAATGNGPAPSSVSAPADSSSVSALAADLVALAAESAGNGGTAGGRPGGRGGENVPENVLEESPPRAFPEDDGYDDYDDDNVGVWDASLSVGPADWNGDDAAATYRRTKKRGKGSIAYVTPSRHATWKAARNRPSRFDADRASKLWERAGAPAPRPTDERRPPPYAFSPEPAPDLSTAKMGRKFGPVTYARLLNQKVAITTLSGNVLLGKFRGLDPTGHFLLLGPHRVNFGDVAEIVRLPWKFTSADVPRPTIGTLATPFIGGYR